MVRAVDQGAIERAMDNASNGSKRIGEAMDGASGGSESYRKSNG